MEIMTTKLRLQVESGEVGKQLQIYSAWSSIFSIVLLA